MNRRTEVFDMEEGRLEAENRIRNLLWTISGDYTQEAKPDVSLFLRSEAIALYDGVKQGALARYYDKNLLGLYLVKKVFLQAQEKELTVLAQLCVEEAIGDRICAERPGIRSMQRRAFTDILEQEYETMPEAGNIPDRFRVMALRDRLDALEGRPPCRVEKRLEGYRRLLAAAGQAETTRELIEAIDSLYNAMIDPAFVQTKGSLQDVLNVTLEDLTEFDWRDYLSEEMYEEALESYVEQLTGQITSLENSGVTEEMEEKRRTKRKITVLSPEALEKTHRYVELNFGKTYLSETEEKRLNYLLCRGIHSDCSLYFTEGILKNPVARNYQYEYAVRLKNKNLWVWHDRNRIAKQNVSALTETLKKSLLLRRETQEILSDRGIIVPSRIWRAGRSREASLFRRELRGDAADFVVDVLIDASGSQMSRQGDVALQAYMISAALSGVQIPHRVMSYCTFWDYTVMHRFREYDDPPAADQDIFNYVTSSNNRDGLAVKAAGHGLLMREEEKKILIILSDGRPYDVIVNRPNARNPAPYQGSYAVSDTAGEIRRLRNLGVSVLGVFAGEEKDLATEKKIFGKDFAYIRDIRNFSATVGRYLIKQLEMDG